MTNQTSKACSVPGCASTAVARGWCRLHYDKWRRLGSTDAVGRGRGCPGDPYATSYRNALKRVDKVFGKARLRPCVICGDRALAWRYDGTDPTEKVERRSHPSHFSSTVRFSVWPEFYKPLCGACTEEALVCQNLK